MEDIIEQQVESAVGQLAAGLIAFVLGNIGIVLLVIAIAVCALALLALSARRRAAATAARHAAEDSKEAEGLLQNLLVSDAFRELELGLAQGETGRRLRTLEKETFALLQQTERLQRRLDGFRPSARLTHEARGLADDAGRLLRSVHRTLDDIEEIRHQMQGTVDGAQRIGERLDEAERSIERLTDRGADVGSLRAALERAREHWRKAEGLAAFDAVQARAELVRLGRRVDALFADVGRLELRTEAGAHPYGGEGKGRRGDG